MNYDYAVQHFTTWVEFGAVNSLWRVASVKSLLTEDEEEENKPSALSEKRVKELAKLVVDGDRQGSRWVIPLPSGTCRTEFERIYRELKKQSPFNPYNLLAAIKLAQPEAKRGLSQFYIDLQIQWEVNKEWTDSF